MVAAALLAERASTRSTVVVPARTPVLVRL